MTSFRKRCQTFRTISAIFRAESKCGKLGHYKLSQSKTMFFCLTHPFQKLGCKYTFFPFYRDRASDGAENGKKFASVLLEGAEKERGNSKSSILLSKIEIFRAENTAETARKFHRGNTAESLATDFVYRRITLPSLLFPQPLRASSFARYMPATGLSDARPCVQTVRACDAL